MGRRHGRGDGGDGAVQMPGLKITVDEDGRLSPESQMALIELARSSMALDDAGTRLSDELAAKYLAAYREHMRRIGADPDEWAAFMASKHDDYVCVPKLPELRPDPQGPCP